MRPILLRLRRLWRAFRYQSFGFQSDDNGRHAVAVAEDVARLGMRLLPYCLVTTALVCPINVLVASSQASRPAGLVLLFVNEATMLAGVAYYTWRRGTSSPAGGTTSIHRRDRGVVLACAAATGLVWFFIPVLLFPGADAIGKLMIASTCAGVICTSLALVPVPAAQYALSLPLIAGSFLGLALTCDTRILGLAVLLAIYGLFVTGAARQFGRLIARHALLRLRLLEQDTTMQLLLGQGDAPSGNFIWETDVAGRLRYVTRALADGIGLSSAKLEGLPLTALLSPPDIEDDDARSRLVACLTEHIAFRNLSVAVAPASGAPSLRGYDNTSGSMRRWLFTGRPLFDERAAFVGFCGVASDVTAAYDSARHAAYASRHDVLTGLPNRGAFAGRLRAALHDFGRRGVPFAVLSLDLDDFKTVNDRCGHHVGDRVLIETVERMRAICGDEVVIGRQGGDEFLGLSFHGELDRLDQTCRGLVAAVAMPIHVDGLEVRVGLSIGVAMAPLAGDTVEALLEAADLALYRVKRDGGGAVCFYEPELRLLAQEHRLLLTDLRKAVRRRDFTLAYQPLVDTQTLAVRGFEALLRWHRPGHGMVPPDRFVRIAEEAGLIGEIGAWVLERACAEAATWPARLRIAINVSVSQIEAPGFARLVEEALVKTGLPARRLELEITESIFMDSDTSSFGVLESLRDMGVHIALDDFGRGFSSLGFLRGFTFSKIKMDKEFVRDMGHDRRSRAVVSAIINLGAELGIVVTAEGVETPQQLAALRKMGCTEAQGYLFSAPVSASALPPLMQRGAIGGLLQETETSLSIG